MKKTILDIHQKGKPLVCLTAYSYPMAKLADKYCDIILVGDSLSMVLYGEDTTQNATMDMMVRHGKAVTRGSENALVIVDMPYGSYEDSPLHALQNAQKIMDETGCDGIKLEGGKIQIETVQYLIQNDIPVMGHIGLLPQSVSDSAGYKVQGKDEKSAQLLMEDALALQEAGAFAIVIEAIPEDLATDITEKLDIPTIGIGASSSCNGQILVTEDMLGLSGVAHIPKFVKQYATLSKNIQNAMATYAREVENREFPTQQHTYKAKNKDDLKKAS